MSHKAAHKNQKGFTRTNFSSKNSRGFTLIELLVVIAIIGILSSVVLASLNSARTKARDARRVADLKQVQVALELFYDANSKYPTDIYAASPNGLQGTTGGGSLSVVPKDPGGTNYLYAVNNVTTATEYHLGADLEQSATQTTLSGSDRDLNSSVAPGLAWPTGTTGSVPFVGDADATNVIYDISNR